MIHRDVRPANILLDAGDTAAGHPLEQAGDQEPDHAYLCDFGLSTAFSPGQVIAADQVGDPLHYLAPEQIEGRALDGRADLYSLACTGFELLCGTPPFGPDQGLTLMYAQLYASPPAATARRADLPAAVDPVLVTALAKDPAGRYPSCSRFAEELGAALGLRPGEQAGPPPSRKPAGPPRSREPAAPGRRPLAARRASQPGRLGRSSWSRRRRACPSRRVLARRASRTSLIPDRPRRAVAPCGPSWRPPP